MKTRKLGNQGPSVSALGLGCMGMSEFYGARNDEESLATLKRALDLGVTFFDTADIYGNGHNEEFIGPALNAARTGVFIATKFAVLRDKSGQAIGLSGKADYVPQACEASLKRLGMDTIDLYYQHRVDPRTPIEETVGAMAALVEAGKVRYLGLSEVSPETLRRAHAVHPITAVQSEYSLWSRDPEKGILATCRELGVGFVPYSPLGRGMLTGGIRSLDDLDKDDWRRTSPRFEEKNFNENLAMVAKIEEIASEKKCTASQLALAWVLAQGESIVPIPGTKRVKYLEENAAAADVELSPDDLDRIDAAIPQGAAAGERYSKVGMMSVDG